MNEKVKQSLDHMVDKLVNEEQLPGFLQKRLFLTEDIPSSKWSLNNQLIMFAYDTFDARGFWQWQKEKRYVKKGSRAFYILAPVVKSFKVEHTSDEGKVEVEEHKKMWFKPVPVFRYEDTEGPELEYVKNSKSLDISALPLIEIAEHMGVEVVKGFSRQYYGAYVLGGEKIKLCTEDEQTFLHELSHAVDHRLGNLSTNDPSSDEIVAELSACFLASLYELKANMLYTKDYIKSYAKGSHIGLVISKLLNRVVAIYDFVAKYKVKVAA